MSATPGADEAVEDRRPGVRLLGGLESIGGLETVGDEDAGLCVDGVCEIPARERDR